MVLGAGEQLGGVLGVALHERDADDLVSLGDGIAAGSKARATAHAGLALGVDGERGRAGLELVAVGGHGLGELVLVADDELARDGDGAVRGRVAARRGGAVRKGRAGLGRDAKGGGAGSNHVRAVGLPERDARGGVGDGAEVDRLSVVGAVDGRLAGRRGPVVARGRRHLDEAVGAPAEALDNDPAVRARLERGLVLDVLPAVAVLYLQLEGAVGEAGGAVGLRERQGAELALVFHGAVAREGVAGLVSGDSDAHLGGIHHVAGVGGLGKGVGALLEAVHLEQARRTGVGGALDLLALRVQAVGLAGLQVGRHDGVTALEREHRAVHAVARGGVGLGERGGGVELVVGGVHRLRRGLGLAVVVGHDGEGVLSRGVDRVAGGASLLEVVLALGQAVGELRVVLSEAGQLNVGVDGRPAAGAVGRDAGGDLHVARVGLLVQVERHREADLLAAVHVVLVEVDVAAHHGIGDAHGCHLGAILLGHGDARGVGGADVARLGDAHGKVGDLEVVRGHERLAHRVVAGRQADDVAVVRARAAARAGNGDGAVRVAPPDGDGGSVLLDGELHAVQALGHALVVGAGLVERELRGRVGDGAAVERLAVPRRLAGGVGRVVAVDVTGGLGHAVLVGGAVLCGGRQSAHGVLPVAGIGLVPGDGRPGRDVGRNGALVLRHGELHVIGDRVARDPALRARDAHGVELVGEKVSAGRQGRHGDEAGLVVGIARVTRHEGGRIIRHRVALGHGLDELVGVLLTVRVGLGQALKGLGPVVAGR